MAHGSHFPPSHAFSRGRVMPFLDSLGLKLERLVIIIESMEGVDQSNMNQNSCEFGSSSSSGGALRPPNRLNSNVMLIDQMGVIENQKPYGIPLSHPNTNISPS
ncbi:hypothetical protein JHK82_052435 [Glycine max]|nr:hypothetical protein JHK82_052435 [Glycine max]